MRRMAELFRRFVEPQQGVGSVPNADAQLQGGGHHPQQQHNNTRANDQDRPDRERSPRRDEHMTIAVQPTCSCTT